MLIKVDKLSKQYLHPDGAVNALKDIAIQIEEGMFVTITGPSGSGKSTLLCVLGGLIRASSGYIRFRDQALHNMSDNDLADFRLKHIGFVMQNFSLIPYLSALRNVMIPLSFHRMDKNTQRKCAIDLLNKVGLGGRLNHLPRELSAGQQQRVAIARALVNNPSLILADEPTGNLDPSLAQEILELLKSLNVEKGITVIMATHSPKAANFGMMRIHLNEGRYVK